MASDAEDRLRSLGWWTISGEALMALLKRAHAGEDPEWIYAEAYANADAHEYPTEDGR